jgi:hypothetical protein
MTLGVWGVSGLQRDKWDGMLQRKSLEDDCLFHLIIKTKETVIFRFVKLIIPGFEWLPPSS